MEGTPITLDSHRGERLLWMTDTFDDRNGVSSVLQALYEEVRLKDLPIDLMVCSRNLESGDHLVVVKPLMQFTLPLYRQQPLRIPDYLQVLRLVRKGRYSRIICSTEGPMGMAALWLRNVFGIKTSFYLHTDWLMFAKEALGFREPSVQRLARTLRFYYRRFDSVFVLNSEQHRWLTGRTMGLDPGRVFRTAHWPDPVFRRKEADALSGLSIDLNRPVVLYAGRISREKGVMELPHIFSHIRRFFPESQLVVAGSGPASEELRNLLPEAIFAGWVPKEKLPGLFKSADILLLPSRFDTFSCVVLEALTCGLPVAAYNTKGPADIIQHGLNGFLAETPEEMSGAVIGYLLDPEMQQAMKEAACRRADDYQAESILSQLMLDTGMFIGKEIEP